MQRRYGAVGLLAAVLLATLPLIRSQGVAAQSSVCLQAPQTFATGDQPTALAVADFNNDGRGDVVVVSRDGFVSVRLGQAGSLGAEIGLSVGGDLASVNALHMTADGFLDLFMAQPNGVVRARLGVGDGTFTGTLIGNKGPLNGHNVANVIGSVNADFLWFGSGLLEVSTNIVNGSIVLSPVTTYAVGPSPHRMAAGDFDLDGDTDLAIINRTTPGTVSIILNDGSGVFGAPVAFAIQPLPAALAIADLDRDGKLDIVVAEDNVAGVSILHGVGNGSFSAATNVPAVRSPGTISPTGVALGDINRDNWQDIVVGTTTDAKLILSDGNGGYLAPVTVATGHISAVAVDDLTGDRWADLLLVDQGNDQLLVIQRCPTNQPPTITAPAAQTLSEDTVLTFVAANGNAIVVADPDAGGNPVRASLAVSGGALTLPSTAGLTFVVGDGSADAALIFDGSLSAVNSALSGLQYAPTPNLAGTATLSVAVNDLGSSGDGSAREASRTVALTVQAVNDAPVAVADSYTVTGPTLTVAAPGVLANDTDVEGSTLTADLLVQSSAGQVVLSPGGGFTYTPSSRYRGADSFTYRASDGDKASAAVTVQLQGSVSACLPRPRVTSTQAAGGGALNVHVESTPLETGANNPLQQIRFGTLQNATVTLNGQSVASAQTVPFPPNTVGADFTVRRVTAGQPTTVPFMVVDSCGAWETFVGGGTGAGF